MGSQVPLCVLKELHRCPKLRAAQQRGLSCRPAHLPDGRLVALRLYPSPTVFDVHLVVGIPLGVQLTLFREGRARHPLGVVHTRREDHDADCAPEDQHLDLFSFFIFSNLLQTLRGPFSAVSTSNFASTYYIVIYTKYIYIL